MIELTTKDILLRLILAMLFSGLIGYEREKNNSSAGLKTHVLVATGSTIVALIQVQTMISVSKISPELNISVDSVRLIAQVISGIGFLGAGAIIITKRSIIGLTTAASIWCVSSLGLSFGMGYYEISIIGSLLILSILIFFKRILVIHGPQQFLIKYIANTKTSDEVNNVIKSFDEKYEILRISTSNYGGQLITTHVYKFDSKKYIPFSDLIHELSKVKNVISVESTEIV